MWGTIPHSLYSSPLLTKLRVFEVNAYPGKHIVGSINERHWNLTALERIAIKNTGIIGHFPKSLLKESNNLKYIDLSKNLLFGSIPDHFANLTNLRYFDVSENEISGPLPYSLLVKSPSLSKCDLSQLPPRTDSESEILWCGAFTDQAVELRGRKIECKLPSYCEEAEPPDRCVSVCNAVEQIKSPPLDFCSYEIPVEEKSHFQCCYADGHCIRSFGRKIYSSDRGPFDGTSECLFGRKNESNNNICQCFDGWQGNHCDLASEERIWRWEKSKNPEYTVPFPTTKKPQVEETEEEDPQPTTFSSSFSPPQPTTSNGHSTSFHHQQPSNWNEERSNGGSIFQYLIILSLISIGTFIYVAWRRNYFLQFVQWILRERLRHRRQD